MGTPNVLALRVRNHLCRIAGQGHSHPLSSSCQGLGSLAAKYDPSTHGCVGMLDGGGCRRRPPVDRNARGQQGTRWIARAGLFRLRAARWTLRRRSFGARWFSVLRGRVQYGRRILARGRRSRGDGYPSSAAIPNIGIKMTLRQGFPKVIGAYGN